MEAYPCLFVKRVPAAIAPRKDWLTGSVPHQSERETPGATPLIITIMFGRSFRKHSLFKGGAFFFLLFFHFFLNFVWDIYIYIFFFGFCFCCVSASAAFLLLLLFCFCFSASAAFVAFLLLLLFCFCCFLCFCLSALCFCCFSALAAVLLSLLVFAFPFVCFLTFGSGVRGGPLRPPQPPPAPRSLHFISDTRACHEINILR